MLLQKDGHSKEGQVECVPILPLMVLSGVLVIHLLIVGGSAKPSLALGLPPAARAESTQV